MKNIFATLAINNTYVKMATNLHRMLKKFGSKYPLIVLTTLQYKELFDDDMNLFLIDYEEFIYSEYVGARFACTLNKFQCLLLEADNVIFLDSDLILTKNIDDLFDTGGSVAYTYTKENGECGYNGSIIYFHPNKEEYKNILQISYINGFQNDEQILDLLYADGMKSAEKLSNVLARCGITHDGGLPKYVDLIDDDINFESLNAKQLQDLLWMINILKSKLVNV